MNKHTVHERPWLDSAKHIEIECVEIDGHDRWIARDEIGIIALCESREALVESLQRIEMGRRESDRFKRAKYWTEV